KFTSTRASEGRSFYVLQCQPKEDENSHYVVFSGMEDAVDFPAANLSTLKTYRPATQAYKKTCFRSETPVGYVRSVGRIMNDPLFPSDLVPLERNPYWLPENVRAQDSDCGQLAMLALDSKDKRNTEELHWAGIYYQNRINQLECEAP